MNRFLKRIDAIAKDRTHGARELYRQGVETLLAWMEERGETHPEELTLLLAKMAEAQPTMAPLLNLVNRVLLAWERGPQEARALLKGILEGEEASTATLIAEGIKVLRGRRIVTLSRSSTLLEVIKALLREGEGVEILISEGRPLMGGVATARLLHEMGAKVTLCTDGLIFSLVREGDVVALGADAITPRFLVNRCGTYPLALVAKDRRVPFYSFTTTEKLLPRELAPLFKIVNHDPREVIKDASFSVVNLYFDQTPLDYITGAVTEKGILTPEELRRLMEKIKVSAQIKEVLKYAGDRSIAKGTITPHQ